VKRALKTLKNIINTSACGCEFPEWVLSGSEIVFFDPKDIQQHK
jgi:hypothetical protein